MFIGQTSCVERQYWLHNVAKIGLAKLHQLHMLAYWKLNVQQINCYLFKFDPSLLDQTISPAELDDSILRKLNASR